MLTNTAWHIILLFWLCCSFSLYTLWPIFYPYYASYARALNSAITMKFIFSLVLVQYIGYSTAFFYTNLMLYYFGLRKSVLIIGLTGLALSLSLTSFGSAAVIVIVFYFVGVIQQAISIITILFFVERHKRVAVAYYSKSLAGQLIGAFIWNEILSYIVNPGNQNLHRVEESRGDIGYYDFECAKRIEQFLSFQAGAVIFICMFVYYHLPESKLYRGVWLKRKTGKKDEDDYKSFQATLHSSLNYFNLQDAKANEILSKFARKQRSDISEEDDSEDLYKSFLYQNLDASSYFNDDNSTCTELQEYTRGVKIEVIETIPVYNDRKPYFPFKDIFSRKFMLLFLTSIVRNSQTGFTIDSLKIHGNFLALSDKSLNHLFSVSVILALILKGLFYKIWDKFGVIDCYCIVIVSNLTFAFLSIDLLNRLPFLFYPSILYMRTLNAFNIFINSMTLYTTYKQSKAIQLSQIFELHKVIAVIGSIAVNYLLVDWEGYKDAYTAYLLVASVGLIVLILVLRAIISRDRLRRMFY